MNLESLRIILMMSGKKSFGKIGLGALKYYILKVDPRKNMTFNPVDSIDFNGNTGPFIQYTYARIKSVLKKAEQSDMEENSQRFLQSNRH